MRVAWRQEQLRWRGDRHFGRTVRVTGHVWTSMYIGASLSQVNLFRSDVTTLAIFRRRHVVGGGTPRRVGAARASQRGAGVVPGVSASLTRAFPVYAAQHRREPWRVAQVVFHPTVSLQS